MAFSPLPQNVTSITKANPAVVTTAANHNYSTGMVVRFIIPKAYGMVELNNLTSIITKLSGTTFSCQTSQIPSQINIDSSNYTAFSNAGTGTPAQVIPMGSGPTQSSLPVNYASPLVGETNLTDQYLNISTSEIPF